MQDRLELEFAQLEKKVLRASDEYVLMFKRSKLLLQENKSILNQLGSHQAASRQSKLTTPSVTPRTRDESSSARKNFHAEIGTLSKIEQVKQIVHILEEFKQQEQLSRAESDEQSSRCHYNIGKYEDGQWTSSDRKGGIQCKKKERR